MQYATRREAREAERRAAAGEAPAQPVAPVVAPAVVAAISPVAAPVVAPPVAVAQPVPVEPEVVAPTTAESPRQSSKPVLLVRKVKERASRKPAKKATESPRRRTGRVVTLVSMAFLSLIHI